MVSLLAKLFIKNHKDYRDVEVRSAYGALCGAVGIFLNLLLSGFKLVAGYVSGSVAIVSDAFNNLSDAASSIIVLLGFKLSRQKPDSEHPYGHGRLEYISGLLVSVLIVFMGFELMKSSIEKVIHPEIPKVDVAVVVILVVSILIKLYMFMYNHRIAGKIGSEAMEATAKDSFSDVIATSAVLLCTGVGAHFDVAIDGWCGIVVSLLIFKAGISSAKDTINPLLGMPPEPEFVQNVEAIILAHPEIIGIHDMVVHNYGPGRVFLSVHAEVRADGDIIELHEVIDATEHELKGKLQCQAVLHMDPVCVNDAKTNELRQAVSDILLSIDENITMHDFRIVPGPTRTNVVFDVVVPYEYKKKDGEIKAEIQRRLSKSNPECMCVIEVDRDFVNKYGGTEKNK